MVAFGENKVGAVSDAVEGRVSEECAASHLQGHDNTLVHLDIAAAHGQTFPGLIFLDFCTCITWMLLAPGAADIQPL